MSRIDDLIQELCPAGVPEVSLGSVAEYVRGVTYSKNDEVSEGGVGILRSNNINVHTRTIDESNLKLIRSGAKLKENQRLIKGDILMSAASGSKEHVGKVAYIFEDTDFYFGGFMAVIRSKAQLHSRYLFHILTSNKFSSYLESAITSTTINNLNAGILNNFTFQIPPVEVQREIVLILDKFTELEAELEAELESRKKQYKFYSNYLLISQNLGEKVALGDLCSSITTGKLDVNAKIEGGRYPFFTCDAKPYAIDTFAFDDEAILISGNGSQVGHVNYYKGKFNAYQRTYVLTDFSPRITVSYLLHTLKASFREYVGINSRKGSVPYITLPMLSAFTIQLPSLEEQAEATAILDKLEALQGDSEIGLHAELVERRKQYEYYRDKLLTFKELDAA